MTRIVPLLLCLPLLACGDKEVEDDTSAPTDDSTPTDDSAPDSEPVDADGDGYTADVDCDDADVAVNPGATEVCDGLDNDCEGTVDQGAADPSTWYADADGDGYPGDRVSVVSCEAPTGFAAEATDCDDLDGAVHPGATEVCDGVDNDCDALVDGDDDSADLSTATSWTLDDDGDGYGVDGSGTLACSQPAGYAGLSGDCDDSDAARSPAAEETCDGSDNDCDDLVDDADPSLSSADSQTFYADIDGDGYGGTRYTQEACYQPEGYVADGSDCDDLDASDNPAAQETCDGDDDDCDGLADDADASVDLSTGLTVYRDDDGDGYGLDGSDTLACSVMSGFAAQAGDCDDTLGSAHPGATEVCGTGIDEDCSGDANQCGISGDLYTAGAAVTYTGTNGDYLGYSVAAGDLDGDGVTDAVIGAYYSQVGAASGGGRALVTHGTLGTSLTLSTAYDAAFDGSTSYDYCAKAIDVGDLDQDGYDDLAVGCYGGDPSSRSSAGLVGLRYGSATRASGATAVTAMDAVWTGGTASDYLGDAVRFVGDLNGDGYPELALGADGADTGGSGAGAVYILAGSATRYSGTVNASTAPLTITGTASSDGLGNLRSISGPIDLDGDGLNDLALGSTGYDGGGSSAGGLFVVYGLSTFGSGSLVISAAYADSILSGSTASDYLGEQPANAGDTDGDGYDDLIVGADGVDSGSVYSVGCAWLVSGSSVRLSGKLGVAATATASFCHTTDYAYLGEATAGGDLDDDGFSDVVLGAYGMDNGSVSSAGAVYVFSGPLSGALGPSDATATIYGAVSADYLGKAVTTLDANNDGIHDLLVGAYGGEQATIWLGGGL